ncbi:mRNA surveillance protein pelota [Natronomonas sp. EA1]|uniref:mRNA surveillance protein pelota n=1 Tax=Natronomonas sp. EA1 TaxID=3421655 RepID=UPI003EB87659
MRIADRTRVEGRRERITVVPESLDDLWHLTYVLEPGDNVSGDTTRRIQRDDDMTRDTGGEREHLWVKLEVDEVEFAKFANRLRVSGTIVDCSREDQLGYHHTLNIEERTEFDIEKEWKTDQLERLQEAVEAAENPDVVIATIEEGEAYVHTVAQYGVEERATITAPTGKGEFARPREELFSQLYEVLKRIDCEAIILAGPGFTKQDALDYIEEQDQELPSKITTVDTSSAGGRGVHEVLKRGAVDRVQAETRIAKEAELIDELMTRIGEGAKATYGVDETYKAAEFGAIETLLILDTRLRQERAGEGDWEIDANDLIDTVEQKGGEVTVFSGEFAPGEQLKNLGGVAALLRYRLQ